LNPKSREFDRFAQDFLGRHPDAVVIHIGCGLDTRFERVSSDLPDNGQVEWYDLDLPDVIDLRRALIGGEGGRYHLLAGSVLDDDWLEAVEPHPAPLPVFGRRCFSVLYRSAGQVVGAEAEGTFPHCRAGL
jgi:O-methyltransferase involved in polyketide biosynthesis